MQKHIFLILILSVILFIPSFAAENKDSASSSQISTADKFYREGLKLISQKRFEEAEMLLKRALKEDSKFVNAYIGLAVVYEDIQRFEEALDELRKAGELEPNNAEIKLGQASVYYHQGKNKEAKEMLEKILEREPLDKRAYNNLGLVYKSLGKFKEAEDSYKKALELDSAFTGARANLSSLYISRGRFVEAKGIILEGTPQDKISNYHLLNNLGIIYFKENNFKEAEELFKRAAEGGMPEAFYNLALVYIKQDEFGKAESEIYKVTDKQPFFSSANIAVGEILCRRNCPDEAEVEYQKARTGGSKDLVFFVKFGNFLIKKGEIQGAIDIYNEAIDIFPQKEILYNNLGVAYFKIKKFDEAEKSFLKALKINGKYADAYFNFGRLCEDREEKYRAVENYKKYLELMPDAADKKEVEEKIKNVSRSKY